MLGDDSPDIHGTNSFTWYLSHGRHSNVESQVFTPYKFGSTAGDRTPDLSTTRPTCYLPLGHHGSPLNCRANFPYCVHSRPVSKPLYRQSNSAQTSRTGGGFIPRIQLKPWLYKIIGYAKLKDQSFL